MQFESFRRAPLTPNLTALVDVVFILVIFVVLVANFQRSASIDVALPSSDSEQRTTPSALTVTLDATSQVHVRGEHIASEQLAATLERLRPNHDALLVEADKSVAVADLVTVLGDAARAGFHDVAIATEQARP